MVCSPSGPFGQGVGIGWRADGRRETFCLYSSMASGVVLDDQSLNIAPHVVSLSILILGWGWEIGKVVASWCPFRSSHSWPTETADAERAGRSSRSIGVGSLL